MNAEPRFPTWRDRLDHERRMSLPQCSECRMRTLHLSTCSKWEPIHSLGYYNELEQRRQYRESVRDMGCTCSDRMPPHTHMTTCELYRTDEEWSEHLTEEHDDDRIRRDRAGYGSAGANSPSAGVEDEHDLGSSLRPAIRGFDSPARLEHEESSAAETVGEGGDAHADGAFNRPFPSVPASGAPLSPAEDDR